MSLSLTFNPLLLFLTSICVVLGYTLTRFKNQQLPPGPKPHLLFGNSRQVPHSKQWIVFSEWGKKYGGHIFFRVFGSSFLVINDRNVAFELLDKRSLIYSDRPQSVMSELIGWDFNMTLYPYGPRWKAHRKVMQQGLNARSIADFRPKQREEANLFLHKLSQSPTNFLQHIEHVAGATIVRLTYGHQLKEGDGYVPMVKEAIQALIKAQGAEGAYLVDSVPILRYLPNWFPGAEFQRLAKKWRVPAKGLLEVPFQAMKKRWLAGTAEDSYCLRLMEELGSTDISTDDELIVKQTAAVLYAAGSDSIAALISTFFLVLTVYPDVQAKAHEEIDRIVGTDRLPNFDDRERLIYMECLLKEVYRWNPAVPLGPAHFVSQEDEFRGRRIPAGTTVLPNLWAMLHDENLYPNSMAFKPSRYFGMTAEQLQESDPRRFTFGFGRRVCVGQHLAEATLYTIFTSVLAVFNVTKPKDEAGREFLPDIVYDHFVGLPRAFSCTITPRSDKARELIENASVPPETD